MGEAGPAAWTEELRRGGRVVFPHRRRRVVFRLLFVVLIGANALVQGPFGLFGDSTETVWDVFSVIFSAMFLFLVGATLWQLITQRPVLTVDREGIRLGRRKPRLAWSEIATVGYVSGLKGVQVLPVIPKDVWANPLNVQQDNVKDLDAFAQWLGELLEQHKSDVQA